MKAFRDALIRDRAKLAETSGNEDCTDTGRVFNVKPGVSAANLTVFMGINGIVHRVSVPGTVLD